MTEKAWKVTERKIAAMIGGERIPITGRIRGDVPDIEHSWLSPEIKHRKEIPKWLHDAYDQANQSAKPDQLPVVILHEERQRHQNDYVLIRLKDFVDYFGKG